MKNVISFFTFLLICSFSINAQELEQYEIEGAKLGKKVARQVVQSSTERTVATNNLEGFSWLGNDKGNRRLTSFVGAMDGAVIGSLARSYSYQNYYQGERKLNYRKKANYSSDISALDIANITYADDDNDGSLGKDESAQLYFDLINTSSEPLYGIMPVLMANKTKHVLISEPCLIDTLKSEHALRYIIEWSGDGKKNPGKVSLMLRIKYGQNQYHDVEHIELGGKRKK